MTMRRLIVLSIVASAVHFGCGASSPSTQIGPAGPWEVQVISNGDTTDVPTMGVSVPVQAVSIDDAVPEGEWFTETSMVEASAAPAAERMLSDFTFGYRIQISANEGSMVLAEARASEADSLYTIPAYVEYERGWYKVRLGDFLTRDEAKAYMTSSAIGERYEKAFVAETYVLKSKF